MRQVWEQLPNLRLASLSHLFLQQAAEGGGLVEDDVVAATAVVMARHSAVRIAGGRKQLSQRERVVCQLWKLWQSAELTGLHAGEVDPLDLTPA
jgi:hypothetical protein